MKFGSCQYVVQQMEIYVVPSHQHLHFPYQLLKCLHLLSVLPLNRLESLIGLISLYVFIIIQNSFQNNYNNSFSRLPNQNQ